MECKFYVGQKVVCVNATKTIFKGPPLIELVEGNVYTVRWVGPFFYDVEDKYYIGIKVFEVIRTGSKYKNLIEPDLDLPFDHHRFKPLDTRKTDISCFEILLNTTKKEIKDHVTV